MTWLELGWSSGFPKHNVIEVFEVLQPPPTSLEHLFISGYPGLCLPRWFQPPSSALSFSRVSQNLNLNDTLGRIDAIRCTFSCLRDLTFSGCRNIVSLDDFLDPASVPVIRKIKIEDCMSLVLVPNGFLGDMHCLEELEVINCPNICSQRLVSPSYGERLLQRGLVLPSSLQRLSLVDCGDISSVVPTCLQNLAFLISLEIMDCLGITSIPGTVWQSYLPSLKLLAIDNCADIESIGGEEATAKIENVLVTGCPKMGDIRRVESLFPQAR